jgi:hypothetical protein
MRIAGAPYTFRRAYRVCLNGKVNSVISQAGEP